MYIIILLLLLRLDNTCFSFNASLLWELKKSVVIINPNVPNIMINNKDIINNERLFIFPMSKDIVNQNRTITGSKYLIVNDFWVNNNIIAPNKIVNRYTVIPEKIL